MGFLLHDFLWYKRTVEQPHRINGITVAFSIGSSVIQLAYFLVLHFIHVMGQIRCQPTFDFTRFIELRLQSVRDSVVNPLRLLSLASSSQRMAHWSPWSLGCSSSCPLAYLLVLIALVFTPASHVAPIREISILFGAVMGTRLLSEGDASRRLVGAFVMILGVVTLAVNWSRVHR